MSGCFSKSGPWRVGGPRRGPAAVQVSLSFWCSVLGWRYGRGERPEQGALALDRGDRAPVGSGGVGIAVLRGPGADQVAADGRQPAAVPTEHAAPDRVRAGSAAGRSGARRDQAVARLVARGPYADARRLEQAVEDLAQPARRTHRGTRAPPRRSRQLHRLRLSQPPALQPLQQERPPRRARPWRPPAQRRNPRRVALPRTPP